jgi:hypothetical protein
MKRIEDILEEYRGADVEKRLNLFLECPTLRNEFMEIDQSEMVGGSLLSSSGKADSAGGNRVRPG